MIPYITLILPPGEEIPNMGSAFGAKLCLLDKKKVYGFGTVVPLCVLVLVSAHKLLNVVVCVTCKLGRQFGLAFKKLKVFDS